MSDIPCQLRVMQHEVDKDTSGLLLNAKVLSEGQWIPDYSALYTEVNLTNAIFTVIYCMIYSDDIITQIACACPPQQPDQKEAGKSG